MKQRKDSGGSSVPASVPDAALEPVRLPDDELVSEYTLTLEEYMAALAVLEREED